MELFTLKNYSFTYPESESRALTDVNLSVSEGDFFVLFGRSGCGKSTLLRNLKPQMAPHGSHSGSILFKGKELEEWDERSLASKIGFVQQSPENQIVTDKVWHELAFGLESLGCDTPTIRLRVAEMASFFGIQNWFHRDVSSLSGGQKQLLNLASVMVMQPDVLILDEPTSQLDPIAASDFLLTLSRINKELGTTIILTEHRLEETLTLTSTCAFMEKGRLLIKSDINSVADFLRREGSGMFKAMPSAMKIWASCLSDLPCPVSVNDGRSFLSSYVSANDLSFDDYSERSTETETSGKDKVISAKDIWFRYEKDGADILKGVSFEAGKGTFLCLLGGNGTGKSTLMKAIAGINIPYRGKLSVKGTVGYLPQNPQSLFLKKTVLEDLESLATGNRKKTIRERIPEILATCELEGLEHRHPYDLSGGEQQRLGLAKLLLLEPDVLLLDEPTKGLDCEFKDTFAQVVKKLTSQGICVIMVSHDIDFCAEYADECALFFDGSIVTRKGPADFFSGNSFYTTSANRMSRGIIPCAVTADDCIRALHRHPGKAKDSGDDPSKNNSGESHTRGGQSDNHTKSTGIVKESPITEKSEDEKTTVYTVQNSEENKRKLPARTKASVISILLLVPITLYLSIFYFGYKQYYLTSVLVLAECMLPFFLVFEGRKPKARELVTIAVLCALNVAGRAVFFMLPQFKPVMAMTIIAGVSLGGETGFLVGAVTMLVSNVLFSQGPWTPWQMFAMGIIGFLAGILFKKGLLRRTRLPLCIFGAISAVIIYGGIMNPASALIWGGESLNMKILLSYYATGLPMDLVQAAATVLFLWFLSGPMLEKLDHIKTKYGIIS